MKESRPRNAPHGECTKPAGKRSPRSVSISTLTPTWLSFPASWSAWALVLIVFGILQIGSGCVSKRKARAAVHHQSEIIAKQQAWIERNQRPGQVMVYGDVKHHQVAWTEDLTLIGAILDAEWLNRNDPRRLVVIRNGERFEVDPDRLSIETDYFLEPGDRIEISR